MLLSSCLPIFVKVGSIAVNAFSGSPLLGDAPNEVFVSPAVSLAFSVQSASWWCFLHFLQRQFD